ncbi:DUF397 domain-containing protein, partial [Saccharopolyspora sp. NPDC002686]|uniref:DUF397 domain-containing protein n=1 Tax=Saccharopolyspora sp. NPDC002686 TaxID=3154541 RepID=UPI003333244A
MTSVSGWRKSSYSQGTDTCIEVGRVSNWRKSSHSQNGDSCIEVGCVGGWQKSSYSQPNGNCVEVGALSGGAAVRDTKDRDGGYFVTTPCVRSSRPSRSPKRPRPGALRRTTTTTNRRRPS